jgi:ferric-dicitrate binding protein FerR (iron transport regulator)
MKGGDFDGLLARLVDGVITQAEAGTLAALLKEDPNLIGEVRQQLELSELISQRLNPARSADAFMASMETRFAADRTGTRFVETTVEKIRQSDRLRRRPRRRAWRWVLPFAACLAVIVGAAAYVRHREGALPGEPVARVEVTSPGVRIGRGEGAVNAAVGTKILAGDVMRTGAIQRVTCSFPGEGTRVVMDGGTQLEFLKTREGTRLLLERGIMDVRVGPRPGEAPIVVATAHAECRIRGTRFLVALGRGSTRLEVQKGVVAFKRLFDGATVDVAAGHLAVAGSRSGKLEAVPVSKPMDPVLPPVMLSRAGKEILHDDFAEGIGNWEPVVEDPPGTFRPLKPEEAKLCDWDEKGYRMDDPGMVRLRGDLSGGKRVGIRLKRRISEGSIIVEYRFKYDRNGYPGVCFGSGEAYADSREYFKNRKYKSSWNTERRELIRLEPEDGFELYDHRCWYFAGSARRCPEIVSADTLRIGKREIIITAREETGRITDVVIRKLARPGTR